jgi:2-keto-myo-inositol isomerase
MPTQSRGHGTQKSFLLVIDGILIDFQHRLPFDPRGFAMNEANPISRRSWLAGVGGGLAAASTTSAAMAETTSSDGWAYCLNTSTVRQWNETWGKSRGIVELIDIASKAGYDAIEPWIAELDVYVKEGGSLKDLGKRIADAGLLVPDAIGFSEWIVEDPERRKKGLEQAKRDMDWVAQIGGKRIAAPPVGATGGKSQRDDPKFSQPITDLLAAADRYRTLLELGQSMGVTPIVEMWGHSKTLKRLGEAFLVASECGHAEGCILPDVYHLFKGGSNFAGLSLLGSRSIGIFHMNDIPAGKDREVIVDADRVYPGDGVAPWKDILAALRSMRYTGFLSLELFNREYWKQDPHVVAHTGLEKLKAVVKNS